VSDVPPAPRAGRVADWTELDFSEAVHEAELSTGRLRYVDIGSGPPLLMIHGLGGSWQTWLLNIPTLMRHHRVVAVDLPGFGRSEALPPPAAVDTHASALAELSAHLELGPAIVVGHSMGGLITLLFAEAHPELTAAVVLVNAGGVPLSPLRLKAITDAFRVFHGVFGRPSVMRAVALRPRLRRIVFAGFLANPDTLAGPFAAEVIPPMNAPGFLGAVAAAAEVVARGHVPALTCPVLLLWGAKDRILPLRTARELASHLPTAELVVIENAGHCPMFEAEDEFNERLLAFTTGLTAPLQRAQ
jgi:pimeloyl-ACP methyl ester carboxylesterase